MSNCSPRSTQHLIVGCSDELDLSDYQRDVLCLMVQGKTPQEITYSSQQSISLIYNAQPFTREKLGVDTTVQAIAVAIRDRLVPLYFN